MRTAIVIVAGLALSGCSLMEPFERPASETPAGWTTPSTAARDETAWPRPDWWTGFGSPVLNELMTAAFKDNLDLAAAVARVRQAAAQSQISGAGLYPSLQANAGFSRDQTPVTSSSTRTTSGGHSVVSNTANTTLGASYEIDFWGKNRATLASAEASLDASRFDQQTAWLTTQASLANTYFAILAYRERVRIARENLRNAEEVLDAIRDRVRAGTATILDQAQQENEVAVERAAIPPLEQQIKQNIDAMAILIGRPPQGLSIATEDVKALSVPVVAPGLPSDLLRRRPDVEYAEAELRAANADIAVARAAFFPSINLTAEGGFQSAALDSLFMTHSLLWSLASSVTQPIFKGGSLEGTLNLKKARYDELVANYRKAVYQSFADVEDGLGNMGKITEQEEAQRQAVATARNAYDISLDQFRAGTVDITTVLNTQRSLLSAEDTLAQVHLSRLQASVTLFRVLGGGWSRDAK